MEYKIGIKNLGPPWALLWGPSAACLVVGLKPPESVIIFLHLSHWRNLWGHNCKHGSERKNVQASADGLCKALLSPKAVYVGQNFPEDLRFEATAHGYTGNDTWRFKASLLVNQEHILLLHGLQRNCDPDEVWEWAGLKVHCILHTSQTGTKMLLLIANLCWMDISNQSLTCAFCVLQTCCLQGFSLYNYIVAFPYSRCSNQNLCGWR